MGPLNRMLIGPLEPKCEGKTPGRLTNKQKGDGSDQGPISIWAGVLSFGGLKSAPASGEEDRPLIRWATAEARAFYQFAVTLLQCEVQRRSHKWDLN